MKRTQTIFWALVKFAKGLEVYRERLAIYTLRKRAVIRDVQNCNYSVSHCSALQRNPRSAKADRERLRSRGLLAGPSWSMTGSCLGETERRRSMGIEGLDGIPRRIVGFHRDSDGHWVAELDCGHSQHVRHNPPFRLRPWVLTEAGRRGRLGATLHCRACSKLGTVKRGKN